MSDYGKLIEALRDECDWTDVSDCIAHELLMHDAAAAIEGLWSENDILHAHIEDMNEVFRDKSIENQQLERHIEALQAEVQELKRVNLEIFEDLPKRGEWLTTKYHTWECSVCGKNPTTGMGYVQTRKALYNYCPNCGAKMEVHE